MPVSVARLPWRAPRDLPDEALFSSQANCPWDANVCHAAFQSSKAGLAVARSANTASDSVPKPGA
jgi:hypothetical protein